MEFLRNAEIFAPEAMGRGDLLVCAGKIIRVGTEMPGFPSGFQVTETDLGGRRLIPGLIDAHLHLTGGGGESGAKSRIPPLTLESLTRNGITTVVGLLGTDAVTRSVADLLAVTRSLSEQGLSAYCHTGGYSLPPATLTGSVRSDIVHLDRVIGVGELAISDHRSSQPTLDEILRIAADAHVAGMMTNKAGILHLHLGDGIRGLGLVREALVRAEIPARVYNPTHVNRRRALFQEALELADRGCTIDVTSFPVGRGEDAYAAGEALVSYLDSGLPPERITVSSDGGGCLPVFDSEGRLAAMEIGDSGSLVRTLSALLDAGQPLERVLPAFTSSVARLLRMKEKGRIVSGADADLVVLDELGNVTDVMALGRWHVRDRKMVIRSVFSRGGE